MKWRIPAKRQQHLCQKAKRKLQKRCMESKVLRKTNYRGRWRIALVYHMQISMSYWTQMIAKKKESVQGVGEYSEMNRDGVTVAKALLETKKMKAGNAAEGPLLFLYIKKYKKEGNRTNARSVQKALVQAAPLRRIKRFIEQRIHTNAGIVERPSVRKVT